MLRTTMIAAVAVFAAGHVAAQPMPEAGPSASEVSDWLQGQGLDAAVSEQGDAPRIESGANGVAWDLTGFDCEGGRCRSWQFSAGFLIPQMPDGAVARWNQQRRYLKAFELEQPGGTAAVAQYDVLITPGMTWEGMTEHMRLFASVAPLFALEMGAIREE